MSRSARVRGALPDGVADVGRALAVRFSVDRRALAAFRVALAAAVLVDIALRLPDVRAFYTDAGVLPRDLLFELYPTLGRGSVHALSGALWWQYALLAALAVAAVAMAVGYRTRLATVVAVALLVSLHLRNPVVLNAGHSLLRRLLVWSTLLPLGARWSVDARRRGDDDRPADDGDGGETPEGTSVRSLAAAGLLLQVLAVYVVNAVVKARGDAWAAGTAGRLVFGMDALTVLLGDVLAAFPTLLTAGTYAWVGLLALSPLLVLATGRARVALVAAFAAGHVAMALTLRLGVFPLVSLAALLPFLPPSVWDRVERAVDDRLASPADALAARLGLSDGPRTLGPSLPATVRDLGGWSTRTVAAVLLAFVLVWNGAALGLVALPGDVTDSVDPEERRWDMFAPEPRSTGGWYVTVGTTTTGERVDLWPGTASTAMPADVDATYPGHRWYFYLTTLRDGPAPPALRERFGQYLCERWNRRHDATLATANVTFVARHVVLDGPDRIEVRPMGVTECATANAASPRRAHARHLAALAVE